MQSNSATQLSSENVGSCGHKRRSGILLSLSFAHAKRQSTCRPSGSKSSLVHQPATHHIRDRVTDRLLGAYPQPKYLRCTQHPRWDHTDRNGWSYHSIRLQTVASERE